MSQAYPVTTAILPVRSSNELKKSSSFMIDGRYDQELRSEIQVLDINGGENTLGDVCPSDETSGELTAIRLIYSK